MDNMKKKRLDARLVSAQPWEIRYWCKRLGVSPERLREAVKAVGRSVAKVKRYFQTDRFTK